MGFVLRCGSRFTRLPEPSGVLLPSRFFIQNGTTHGRTGRRRRRFSAWTGLSSGAAHSRTVRRGFYCAGVGVSGSTACGGLFSGTFNASDIIDGPRFFFFI